MAITDVFRVNAVTTGSWKQVLWDIELIMVLDGVTQGRLWGVSRHSSRTFEGFRVNAPRLSQTQDLH